ncbi:hypothetical protein BQ8420_27510 [Nocardiopsis sp. JB363]|nr:hypothetical protein BQ8420_27510 [Nocardiopsis sp. JB363]
MLGQRSCIEVSGAKGLFIILGAMFGFMAFMAVVATAVTP